MQETRGSSLWTEADELLSVAGYHAVLTLQLGTWLHASCAGILIPFFGTGILGMFLLAGAVVMAVAIPVRVWLWHDRFGTLDLENPEIVTARKTLRRALLLWGLSPVTFVIVVMVMSLVYRPLLNR